MISTTLIYIAAILGTNIFRAYRSNNIDKYKAKDDVLLENDNSTERNKENVVDYSLGKFEISICEKKVYESLKEGLRSLNSNDDIDIKLANFKNISSRIAHCYKNSSFPLPRIERPNSVKIMEVLDNRFKSYAKDDNLSDLFDKTKFYIEFCLREYVDSSNDKIFHYLLDNVHEGKSQSERDNNEIINEYSEDFEKIFLPIITSVENKRRNTTIENKYKDTFSYDNKILNYFQLLDYSGTLYNQVIDFYKKYGIYIGNNAYNHDVVYDIAKTILTISDFYFTHGMPVSNLAHDITNYNINFLHHDQPEAKEGENVDDFLNRIMQNYFSGRTIRNYYYFLVMCARVYHSLEKNWKSEEKKLFIDISDENEFKRKALDLVYNRVKDMQFPFLDGLSKDDIMEHILKTNPEP